MVCPVFRGLHELSALREHNTSAAGGCRTLAQAVT